MNGRGPFPVPSPRVRVYLASTLDGFIAGGDNDLSWLPEPAATDETPPGALDFPAFLEQVGALLMGRRTWEVVRSFGIPWPYGDRPVLVASHRPPGSGPSLFAGLGAPYRMELAEVHRFPGGMVQLRLVPAG